MSMLICRCGWDLGPKCSSSSIKATIHNTQENRKCSLFGNREESVSHIIGECSKQAQKEYKNRHDWVGKEIN